MPHVGITTIFPTTIANIVAFGSNLALLFSSSSLDFLLNVDDKLIPNIVCRRGVEKVSR